MELKEKIEQKFEKLLKEGKLLLEKGGWDGEKMRKSPSDRDYLRFKTGVANLIKQCCGKDSDHYREVMQINKQEEEANYPALFPQYMGILEAAYQDFSEDFLFDIRSLIRAELHGDFLGQAETLFEETYSIAAACLTGAVLEDSLRKLCVKNSIEVPERSSINNLNVLLAKAKVYENQESRDIKKIADIRNYAAHGENVMVNDIDVDYMIKWVKIFDAKYMR